MSNRSRQATTAGFAAAIAFFVLSRAILHFGLAPFFEGDTYKYLGGADALWAGQALPPLFQDLPRMGGGLHAVPGYCVFLEAVWTLCGGITLRGVLVAQSLLALAGYLAGASMVRRWFGDGAGLAFLVVLVTAPTLAWLEHLLMPDVLAIPLFLVPAWSVLRQGERGSARGWTASGALGGALSAAQCLLRATGNLFAPLLVLLALAGRPRRRDGLRDGLGWLAGFAIAFLLGVAPWLFHNHRQHDVWRITASSGRHLYFSALWSGILDRPAKAAEAGMPGQDSRPRSQEIADRELQRLLASGLSLPEADAAMGRQAMAAYAALPFAEVLRLRGELLWSLFQPSSETAGRMEPLRDSTDRVLQNPFFAPGWRDWTVARLGHVYSEELVRAQEASAPQDAACAALVRGWMKALTLDGPVLLVLFLAAWPALLRPVRHRGDVLRVLLAPPLVFLGMFAMAGLPRYRYQVALHPYLYGFVVVALASLREERRDASAEPSGEVLP